MTSGRRQAFAGAPDLGAHVGAGARRSASARSQVAGPRSPQGRSATWRRWPPARTRGLKPGGPAMRAGDSDVHLRDRLPTSAEPAAAWRPYVETCVEAFGPSRRTFESGLPVDKGMGGYAVMWNASKRLRSAHPATTGRRSSRESGAQPPAGPAAVLRFARPRGLTGRTGAVRPFLGRAHGRAGRRFRRLLAGGLLAAPRSPGWRHGLDPARPLAFGGRTGRVSAQEVSFPSNSPFTPAEAGRPPRPPPRSATSTSPGPGRAAGRRRPRSVPAVVLLHGAGGVLPAREHSGRCSPRSRAPRRSSWTSSGRARRDRATASRAAAGRSRSVVARGRGSRPRPRRTSRSAPRRPSRRTGTGARNGARARQARRRTRAGHHRGHGAGRRRPARVHKGRGKVDA
jgi:hypothetical protein